jgi:carboxymethylenebutenolidase
MSDSMTTRTALVAGDNGDDIEAYLIEPTEAASPRGGVVVIHHLPGYDRATKEIARRVGELGYNVAMPNLYWREAPGADPDDAAATVRATGGIADSQVIGDVAGAAAYLRGLDSSNGKVGVMGFCSGGRQTVLVACSIDIDAAIDITGGAVLRPPPASSGFNMPSLESLLPSLGCPLLGLFGNEDQFPSPDEVDDLDRILTELGKPHEFHRYDDTGHGFFHLDRPSYRVAAANEGWQALEEFYGRYLS